MCLAVPLRLIEIAAERSEGTVDMAGSTMNVSLDLIPEAKPGDYILVHAGMGIEVLKEGEAEETLEIYRQYAHLPGLLEPASGEKDE